jgi:hypothetical protein
MDLLHIEFFDTQTADELDKIVVILSMWAANCDKHFVMHLEHSQATDRDIQPLDAKTMCALVARLVEHEAVLKTRVSGVCVQARRVDPIALAAKTLFVTRYKPTFDFDIVDSRDAVNAFLTPLMV